MTEKFTEGAEPSLCKLEIYANSCGVSMGLNLSLHMWETVVKAWTICGSPGNRTSIYPWCMR